MMKALQIARHGVRYPRHRRGDFPAVRGLEMDPRDGESVADLRQSYGRACVDPLWREAGTRQLGGQCHREAAGVGSAEELFWIRGRFTVLQARLERVWPPKC